MRFFYVWGLTTNGHESTQMDWAMIIRVTTDATCQTL